MRHTVASRELFPGRRLLFEAGEPLIVVLFGLLILKFFILLLNVALAVYFQIGDERNLIIGICTGFTNVALLLTSMKIFSGWCGCHSRRFISLVVPLIMLKLCWVAYIVVCVPISGWDVLTHWAPTAVSIINGAEATIFAGNQQPNTYPLLLGTFFCLGSKFFTYFLALEQLVLYAIPVVLMASGSLPVVTRVPIVGFLLLAPVPLFENHILVAGYAELLLGLALVLVVLPLEGVPRLDVLSVLVAACLFLFIKDSGILFAACLVGGVIVMAVKRWLGPLMLFALAAVIVSLTFTLIIRTGNSVPETEELLRIKKIAGLNYVAVLRRTDFESLTVIQDLFLNLFKNHSFYQAGLLVGCAFFGLSHFVRNRLFSPLYLTLSIFSLMALPVVFDAYALTAAWNSDTSFSRSLLPLYGVFLLLLFHLVNFCSLRAYDKKRSSD